MLIGMLINYYGMLMSIYYFLNQRFSGIFRGYKKKIVASNGLIGFGFV